MLRSFHLIEFEVRASHLSAVKKAEDDEYGINNMVK